MSTSEWCIYVMSNPAMPGIVKIGGSMCPESRRDQLSMNTAVPLPFVLEYSQPAEFGRDTEGLAHIALMDFRISPVREFFKVIVTEAVTAVQHACLLANWNKAGEEAREQFLERIGAA